MICISAQVFLGYFIVMTFPAHNVASEPSGLVYYRAAIARGMPLRDYDLRQIRDGLAEISTPDGRKFKVGTDEVHIECPPVTAEKPHS